MRYFLQYISEMIHFISQFYCEHVKGKPANKPKPPPPEFSRLFDSVAKCKSAPQNNCGKQQIRSENSKVRNGFQQKYKTSIRMLDSNHTVSNNRYDAFLQRTVELSQEASLPSNVLSTLNYENIQRSPTNTNFFL